MNNINASDNGDDADNSQEWNDQNAENSFNFENEETNYCQNNESFRDQIHQWVVDNIGNLPMTSVTSLLGILRKAGHSEFPKLAHTLLGYKHAIKSKPMLSSKNGIGRYIYLGILNGLLNRLTAGAYRDNKIEVFVHIDGAALYNNTRGQVWPIVMTMYHKEYTCVPFSIALFYGNSKPKNVDEFLKDFVEEAIDLTVNGITVLEKHYQFKILGIIADGPARAFIKCIKGPTGYFACERCTVPGVTENKRRVYPENHWPKRTKESFTSRVDKQHQPRPHLTPIIQIPGLDPIHDFPQEVMHLFLNLVKNLMGKWIDAGSKYKLRNEQLTTFKTLMADLTKYIPKEFQRKEFDIEEYKHWKATQCSFLLLYAGPIVLQFVLPRDEYDHFLLVSVAYRLLCSSNMAVDCADEAERYLCKFVALMPTFYGLDSQVLHIHSNIHTADDVKYFQAPLSHYSAFWGENFIGRFKSLITGRAKPLQQIVNKISIQEQSRKPLILRKKSISDCILKRKREICRHEHRTLLRVHSVKYEDMTLTDCPPNNIVTLHDGRIIFINRIYVNEESAVDVQEVGDLIIKGFPDRGQLDSFTRPCPSAHVGITQVKSFKTSAEFFNVKDIKNKSVFMKINDRNYSVSLLHTV
uniref:Transposase domain-containing protein n=1 Tax=Bracon brevicornis TaxID=1563983 RepID=A0A6V7LQH2_9HYME